MTATATATKPKVRRSADAVLSRAEKVANEALVAKVDEIKTRIRELTETDIKKRWDLGRTIHAVMTDETGVYGDDPGEAVQNLMPLSRDSIRPMVVMAERYDEAEVDALIALRHPRTKEGLTWSHVMSLSRVRDKAKMMTMADKAVQHGWSSKELAAEVTAAAGGPKSSGGRKGKVRPITSLAAGLTEVGTKSADWINTSNNSWLAENGLADLLAAVTNPTADTVSMIEQALSIVDRLTVDANVLGRQLALMVSETKKAIARNKVI